MRRVVGTLFLCVLVGGAAADAAPETPRTIGDVARASIEAFDAGDADAMSALAGVRGPDPWLVVDELHYAGRLDVARSYAAEIGGPVARGLGAYVESRQDQAADEAARTAVGKGFSALRAGAWREALDATQEIEAPLDSAVRIEAVFARAHALRRLDRLPESAATFDEAAKAAREIGWRTKEGLCYRHAARSASSDGDWQGKLAWCGLARRAYAAAGDPVAAAQATSHMSLACVRLARDAEALDLAGQVLEAYESLRHGPGVADALFSIGQVHAEFGRPREARRYFERGLGVAEESGPRALLSRGLANLGAIEVQMGQYDRARKALTRARELAQAAGSQRELAGVLGNLGSLHFLQGDYPRALALYRDALSAARAAGDARSLAGALDRFGALYARLAQQEKALEYYAEALRYSERAQEGPFTAGLLGRMGSALRELGRHEEATASFRRALAAAEALGDPATVVIALLDLGEALAVEGKREAAASTLNRAATLAGALENTRILAGVHAVLGRLFEGHGQHREALLAYERSLTHLGATPSPYTRANALAGMARIHLGRGESARAVELARDAVVVVSDLFQGLGEEEGTRAKDAYARLFSVGLQAAVGAEDLSAVAHFLEHARAGALHEGLGSREAFSAALLPAGLREDIAVAQAAEQSALLEYRAAMRTGRRKDLIAARRKREQAQAAKESVVVRLQRDAKRAAPLLRPRPDELAVIQQRLEAGDVLVYYGIASEQLIALVVRASDAKVIELGPRARIETAVRALLLDDDPFVAPEAAEPLRRLLGNPLDLGDDAQRILVCPAGGLAYVPFGMIFAGMDVVYVPSGTVYGLLREERRRPGEGILALGDPAYGAIAGTPKGLHRGRSPDRMVRLPATRGEVEAIGTVTLLGTAATESGLAGALRGRDRWRAVHFACHGLIDPQRPLLSSLALTPDLDHDGLLTCLEIFQLSIPADLVVLSACETARGRIYETEGVLGLPRAFLYAGSPCVLCSLWSVDDAATQAFMRTFYAAWSPTDGKGASAAAALRQAQEHVRSQAEWSHPTYWAAWILWGLPG